MKKIISLFQRNYDGDRLVRSEITPGAEWVTSGEGVATRKFDGTCCRLVCGRMFKRYEVKKGGKPPLHFEPANEPDATTGKQQGWVPINDGPEDQWHREALALAKTPGMPPLADGTYELIGPKIQGNPEKVGWHTLLPHGYLFDCDKSRFLTIPRDFEGIKNWLESADVEGIVWHHPDGRMVKIKTKDFGLPRR